MQIDTPFKPLGLALLTISDTRTEQNDTSGDILAERIISAGHRLLARKICKDDIPSIQDQVSQWVADTNIGGIITTGGTGLTGRDNTPEALLPLFDKVIDGFSVMFHMVSHQSIGMSTLQSRAVAGLAGGTYIFALPGSNGAVKDGWDKILATQLDSRTRPCNMINIIPRLQES